jgi:hypothetical protein
MHTHELYESSLLNKNNNTKLPQLIYIQEAINKVGAVHLNDAHVVLTET